MRSHSAAHLDNLQIKQRLIAKIAESQVGEAEILVLMGEADARKLYIEEGYSSMHAWCVEFFHFSREVAFRRVTAARTARAFPILLEAVADGRLHLSAIRLIAGQLTPENVEEMVAAATHRTCEEIEEMLARRCVRLETLLEGSSLPLEPSIQSQSLVPLSSLRPKWPL